MERCVVNQQLFEVAALDHEYYLLNAGVQNMTQPPLSISLLVSFVWRSRGQPAGICQRKPERYLGRLRHVRDALTACVLAPLTRVLSGGLNS